jgi:hypothetical protein
MVPPVKVVPMEFLELQPVEMSPSEEEHMELPAEQPLMPLKEVPSEETLAMEFLAEHPEVELPLEMVPPVAACAWRSWWSSL